MATYQGKTEAEWLEEADYYKRRWNRSNYFDTSAWDNYRSAKTKADLAKRETEKENNKDTTPTVSSSSSTSTVGSGSSSTIKSGSSTSTIASSITNTVAPVTVSPATVAPVTSTYTPRIYAGGDQVITDYQSGEQIFLGTMPTGYIFGGGNFALTSAAGNLFIANANDKLIDFVDGAGNPFAKAYAATNPGVIDGRGLAGHEHIVGSDFGADAIFAGDGGSQLWGGNGLDADTLVGGAGADIFIGGRMQGADSFVNAASTDVVFLNDSTLGDIVAAVGDGGAVAIAFNTGNVVMIGSSEAISAAVMLADGSAYRYNHAAQAWQGA